MPPQKRKRRTCRTGPHDTSVSCRSMTCYACGGDDRVFETCNTPNCNNMVCVDGCEKPCKPDTAENTWKCQQHGGTNEVTYCGNKTIDIRVLLFRGSPFGGGLFKQAANMISRGYANGTFNVREFVFCGESALQGALKDLKYRDGTRRWIIAGVDAYGTGDVWVGRWSLLADLVRSLLFGRDDM